MSKDDIAVVQEALHAWPQAFARSSAADLSDAARRVLDAASGLGTRRTGWLDVAALVRQVLLTTKITYGGAPNLVVPARAPWPAANQWREVGCTAVPLAGSCLRIAAEEWAPPAMLDGGTDGVELGLQQIRVVYQDTEPPNAIQVSADPFWSEAHGYPTYRGEPQRQAARAAVLSDGASLAVALPTGRGKTAVAWSKTLLSEAGVTVVVVPTVVLALDMERRTRAASAARELTGSLPLSPVGRYAYVGSLDASIKKQLRDAVRAGSQRLLYTPHEALVSSLAPALIDCARTGRLQQVVIDEAHLVDQWGADFRSEFQTMPGLIREAWDVAPDNAKPSILQLSATLAQRPLDILTQLFDVGGRPVDVVWGSELRAEPAFFVNEFASEDERGDAVLEAVRKLPRPLILYTSKVADAEAWAARLQEHGLSRVAAITGKSNDEARRAVIERWRGEAADGATQATSLDVVVGTSAFGLGLDMPNVRTIVHACLPETIDRYYQEVGRAGRDGRPSIALLCRAPDDLRTARSLNRVQFIGDDLGWKRWLALLDKAEQLEYDALRFRATKSTLPTYLEEGYGRSARWNLRTLTLMAQAGIIGLRVPRYQATLAASGHDDEAARDAFYDRVGDLIEFELKDGSLLQKDAWQLALSAVRTEVRTAQDRALDSLLRLVSGSECAGRVIAGHYDVRHEGGLLKTMPACRGCPACRRNPGYATGLRALEPRPALPAPRRTADPFAEYRGTDPLLFIWLAEGQRAQPILVRLAQRGVHVFAMNPTAAVRLQREVRSPIVHDDAASVAPLVEEYEGVVVVVTAAELSETVQSRIASGLPTYLIGPDDVADPARPGNLLRDTRKSLPVTAALGAL